MDTNLIKCPQCKEGTIMISKVIYDLPDEDKMLLVKLECDNCGFFNRDIIPLSTRTEPGVSEYYITEEEDLKSKVYRSPTAKLEIPELEVEVEPGPSAEFYFTNIEGILQRFETAVLTHRNSLKAENISTKDIDIILKNMKRAYKGDFPFTLKIIDPQGSSYIIPQDESKYSFKNLNI